MREVREKVKAMFAKATGRPVFWADERTTLGDFEGRDATLEIFDVPSSEERALFRSLRLLRTWADAQLRVPVLLMFHTPAATRKHYAWALQERRRLMADLPHELGSAAPLRCLPERRAERVGLAGSA
jgi:hypothetical protein